MFYKFVPAVFIVFSFFNSFSSEGLKKFNDINKTTNKVYELSFIAESKNSELV